MKKVSIVLLCFIAVVAFNSSCGSGGDKGKTGDNAGSDADYQAGLKLTGTHNCITCHRPIEAFTGPSYADIAEKYKSDPAKNVPMLAEKIIKGGSGNWGTSPMIPHPDISQQDAETMVKYIFQIKK